MKIYYYKYDANMCGTDVYGLVEAENEDEVYGNLETEVYEYVYSYNGEDDGVELELNCYVVEYDPAKHNPHLNEEDKLYMGVEMVSTAVCKVSVHAEDYTTR